MFAQAVLEYGVLAAFVEQVRTVPSMMSSWVSSLGTQELLLIGGAVVVGMLGYQLVLRRR